MKPLPRFRDIVDKYDVFLLDAWGVLHDGFSPLPGVVETLEHLKNLRKKTIIVTNSPSRKEPAIIDLEKRGIDRTLYGDLVSSGDVAFQGMKSLLLLGQMPRRCVFLGQPKHGRIVHDLSLTTILHPEAGSFLFNTGPNSPHDSEDVYLPILSQAAQCNMPMVCVNPDRTALFQGKRRLCAGRIAELYEQLQASVLYFGKPYPEIYDAVKQMVPVDARILAIGDSLETDIRGAANANMDTMLVFTGLTSRCDPLTIESTYNIQQLQW